MGIGCGPGGCPGGIGCVIGSHTSVCEPHATHDVRAKSRKPQGQFATA